MFHEARNHIYHYNALFVDGREVDLVTAVSENRFPTFNIEMADELLEWWQMAIRYYTYAPTPYRNLREAFSRTVVADYFLKTDDGVVINVRNTGTICRPAEGQAPVPVRTHPVFEPPLGKYQWLGEQTFVGTLALAPPSEGPAVRIRFYRVK